MSISFLLGLSTVLHFYVGARLASAFPFSATAGMVLLLVGVSALIVPMSLFARRVARPPLSDTLTVLGLMFMGLFSSLLVLTALRDLLLALGWLIGMFTPAARPGHEFRAASAAAVPALALAITLLGFINARRTAGVVRVDVPVTNLPPALEGFTIVQITDIHVGPTIKQRYVEGIVEAVNRLKPDIVAITGDLVDGTVADLGRHVAVLERLVSRHGSFFVTGNHEYYSGVEPWMAELQRLGIRVLHNEHVVINVGGAKLVLAGVPDFAGARFSESHRSDPRASIAGAPVDAAVKILLAHQPRSAPAAAAAGFDLQLSGHTHGGQFLPWNFLVKLQQPFTAGMHRLGELRVYVSRGTGYWGPPKRFGAPSEITQLRLMSAAV
ncbi:MAG: metallophosphoesterase [Ramlibacter sp.]